MTNRAVLSFLVWLGALAVPLLTVAQESQRPAPPTLLAGTVLLPDGNLQSDSVVVIKGGKIQRIAKRADLGREKGPIHMLGDSVVISPGLIDLFATPGVVGQTVEDTETVEPDATPQRVLDPSHPDFRRAVESGITTVLVGPAATNLVNGICVSVRTHSTAGLDVLRNDGPILFAFGEGVWRSDRAPTSRSGALLKLREIIADARANKAQARVNAAVAGKLDALITCTSKQDVLSALQALGDVSSRFGMITSKDALELVDEVKKTRQPVVLGPYTMATDRRELMGAASLSDAGVEVAFRAGYPVVNARALRLSAALAVRSGMDPAAARRAITISPANVAGIAKRVGSVAAGKDADLVLFSCDPLRLDAQVLEVYVLGQRVYSAKHQSVTSNGLSLEGAQP